MHSSTKRSACPERFFSEMNVTYDWTLVVFGEGGVELKLALNRGNIKRFVQERGIKSQ